MLFELKKSDTDPRNSALHLDLLLSTDRKKEGSYVRMDLRIKDFELLAGMFDENELIRIDADDMYHMNFFSISERVIVYTT